LKLTSQIEATELVKTALGSLEKNETENQQALDGFNRAAHDAAIFEVGSRGHQIALLEHTSCCRLPCFS